MDKVNKRFRSSLFFGNDFPFHIAKFRHNAKEYTPEIIHKREFWKIIFVVKGHGKKIINSETYPMKSGSLFVIHPEDNTAFDIKSSEIEIYNILFMPELIADGIKELNSSFSFFSILQSTFDTYIKREVREQFYIHDSTRDIETLIKRIDREYKRKAINYRSVLKFQLLELLALICRLSTSKIKRNKERLIGYIYHIINEHYMDNIDLAELTKETGMTQSHLCRTFRAESGVTITDALRTKRLSVAEELLKNDNLSISEICYSCGFNDLSYFYRAFKDKFRSNPGQYRKKIGLY